MSDSEQMTALANVTEAMANALESMALQQADMLRRIDALTQLSGRLLVVLAQAGLTPGETISELRQALIACAPLLPASPDE